MAAPKKPNPQKDTQDLDIYWDQAFADLLETWGADHVWKEIQMLFVGCSGKVLDIACGTGVTIELVANNKSLEVHGCDISEMLIERAVKRGIDQKLLNVCDATKMDVYTADSFDHSYSIGSLEHFTDKGISQLIKETYRITKTYSFHMVPVSANNKNNGWIVPLQGYYNNSRSWWLDKFNEQYKHVTTIESSWKDSQSIGMWFVCRK